MEPNIIKINEKENEIIEEVDDPTDLPIPIFHGFPYPHVVRESQDKFDAFRKQVRFKDGDVIQLSYPKAGNHWANGFLGMLMTKSKEITKVHGGLMEIYCDSAMIETCPHPRIFFTHIPYHQLPRDIIENKKIKILLLIRNPKDTAVSYYHFMKKWICRGKIFTGNLTSFVKPWIEGRLSYGSWFDYYRSIFENFVGLENVHVVQYEKMKSNFVPNLRHIAKFLNVDVSDDFLKIIESKTSLPEMSKWATGQMSANGQTAFSDYFRKGVVGDWRTQMEEDDARKIDEMLEELKPLLKGYEDVDQ